MMSDRTDTIEQLLSFAERRTHWRVRHERSPNAGRLFVRSWRKHTYGGQRKAPLFTDTVEKVLLNTGENLCGPQSRYRGRP
jgi:hypothetical protein